MTEPSVRVGAAGPEDADDGLKLHLSGFLRWTIQLNKVQTLQKVSTAPAFSPREEDIFRPRRFRCFRHSRRVQASCHPGQVWDPSIVVGENLQLCIQDDAKHSVLCRHQKSDRPRWVLFSFLPSFSFSSSEAREEYLPIINFLHLRDSTNADVGRNHRRCRNPSWFTYAFILTPGRR